MFCLASYYNKYQKEYNFGPFYGLSTRSWFLFSVLFFALLSSAVLSSSPCTRKTTMMDVTTAYEFVTQLFEKARLFHKNWSAIFLYKTAKLFWISSSILVKWKPLPWSCRSKACSLEAPHLRHLERPAPYTCLAFRVANPRTSCCRLAPEILRKSEDQIIHKLCFSCFSNERFKTTSYKSKILLYAVPVETDCFMVFQKQLWNLISILQHIFF